MTEDAKAKVERNTVDKLKLLKEKKRKDVQKKKFTGTPCKTI